MGEVTVEGIPPITISDNFGDFVIDWTIYVSDGFHTFNQLYHQRAILFAALVNQNPDISWKTKRHEDGELCFGGGWFLVTIDTV